MSVLGKLPQRTLDKEMLRSAVKLPIAGGRLCTQLEFSKRDCESAISVTRFVTALHVMPYQEHHGGTVALLPAIDFRTQPFSTLSMLSGLPLCGFQLACLNASSAWASAHCWIVKFASRPGRDKKMDY